MAATDYQFTAKCHCGNASVAIKFSVERIMWSCYCHCRLCQGFYAAPAAALLGLPEDCVQLSLAEGSEADETVVCKSSEPASRVSCRRCGVALLNRITPFKAVGVNVVLFRPSEDEPIPPVLMPRCHIFYKRRLCDVADALPKYDEYCPIPPGYTE